MNAVEVIEQKIATTQKYLKKVRAAIDAQPLDVKDDTLRYSYQSTCAYLAGLRFGLSAIKAQKRGE